MFGGCQAESGGPMVQNATASHFEMANFLAFSPQISATVLNGACWSIVRVSSGDEEVLNCVVILESYCEQKWRLLGYS